MLFGTLAFLPILGLIAGPGGAKRQAYAVVLTTGAVLFALVGAVLALMALLKRHAGMGFAAVALGLNLAAIFAAVWLFAGTIITK